MHTWILDYLVRWLCLIRWGQGKNFTSCWCTGCTYLRAFDELAPEGARSANRQTTTRQPRNACPWLRRSVRPSRPPWSVLADGSLRPLAFAPRVQAGRSRSPCGRPLLGPPLRGSLWWGNAPAQRLLRFHGRHCWVG